MKVKMLILVLISLFLLSCENTPKDPFSPELKQFPPKTPAYVWVSSRVANHYVNYNDPTKTEWRIWGELTHGGDFPARDIKINSKIYDSSWNVLWEGSFLFINPITNSSYLDNRETCDFVASWEGLNSNIFNEWDPGKSFDFGITITWEEVN